MNPQLIPTAISSGYAITQAITSTVTAILTPTIAAPYLAGELPALATVLKPLICETPTPLVHVAYLSYDPSLDRLAGFVIGGAVFWVVHNLSRMFARPSG